jgi:hypothetical protein
MVKNATKEQLFLSGITYLRMGLSVIVVGSNKSPIHRWVQYQSYHMSQRKLQIQLDRPEAYGIAIIGGKVSLNFVTYDIDLKNDVSGQLYTDLVKKIQQQSETLMLSLPIATTPSGGYHFYYLTPKEFPSLTLAKSRISVNSQHSSEQMANPVLIELRAKGEYAIVPPSPGYQFVQNDFNSLPMLQEPNHKILVSVGESFNQLETNPASKNFLPQKKLLIGSPLDDFDNRGNIIELLLKHGWTLVEQSKDPQRIYFKRPGNTKHKYSANFHLSFNTFITHSTSTIFLAKNPYKPSAVFTYLECNGDFTSAAKQLLELGFGIPYNVQRMMGLK